MFSSSMRDHVCTNPLETTKAFIFTQILFEIKHNLAGNLAKGDLKVMNHWDLIDL